ncbi:coiled-coil domain-containing protein 43 isoform X2 [Palaemon carinicauda]
MAEALPCDFDTWLKDTLVGLNTDDEVFSPYIKGILESEENDDEKMEALQGILTEITESGIDELCQDILKKWTLIEEEKVPENNKSRDELDAKIAKIMEEQAQCVTQTKTISKEQAKLKSAILAQYAQVSDGEVTDDEEEGDSGGGGFCLKNTNATDVVRAERERRDKDKEEAQRKKEKDKEDR